MDKWTLLANTQTNTNKHKHIRGHRHRKTRKTQNTNTNAHDEDDEESRTTKTNMEALSVLQAEVERLWEVRVGWEKRIGRIKRRMENEEERARRVVSRSAEESALRSEAVAEEEGRITMIRGKISRVDGMMRLLEERIDRIQEEGEREGMGEEEHGRVMLDEFERAIEKASRRADVEQSMLERLRRESSWMRGEVGE